MRYTFAKGYIEVNFASLTVSEVGRAAVGSGWFGAWLTISDALRQTTFADEMPTTCREMHSKS